MFAQLLLDCAKNCQQITACSVLSAFTMQAARGRLCGWALLHALAATSLMSTVLCPAEMPGKYCSIAIGCIAVKIIACQQVPNGMIGSNNGMMGGNNGMVPMASGQNPHMPGMVPIMQSPQLPNIQGSCALWLFDMSTFGQSCIPQ